MHFRSEAINHSLLGQARFQISITNACKIISVSEFSHLLDLIVESLSDVNELSGTTSCLVQLLTLLIQEAPES